RAAQLAHRKGISVTAPSRAAVSLPDTALLFSAPRPPMRIALALAALALTMPAMAETARTSHAHLACHKTGERVGRLTKPCYYDCGIWEGGLQEHICDHCPGWTLRWRLNRNSQFGPRTRRKVTG